MPFFSYDESPTQRAPIGEAPTDDVMPNFSDLARASFMSENMVASGLSYLTRPQFPAEPDHNPMSLISGSRYFYDFGDRFYGSQSTAETRSIMSQIDREERDGRIRQSAGVAGVAMDLLAGNADPTLFIPGAALVKTGRAGWTVTRSAMAVGASTAAMAAVQESALYASQQTRTADEVAVNIGTATLLGGILGAGAGTILSRGEREVLAAKLNTDRRDMALDLEPEPKLAEQISEAPPASDAEQAVIGANGATRESAHSARLQAVREFNAATKSGDLEWVAMARKGVINAHRALEEVDPDAFQHFANLPGNRRLFPELREPRSAPDETLQPKPQAQTSETASEATVDAAGRPIEGSANRAGLPADIADNIDQPAPPLNSTGRAGSAGASASDARKLELQNSAGIATILNRTPGLNRITGNPMTRTFLARFQSARRAMADVAETSLRFEQNREGIPTTQGPAVDRMARLHTQQAQVRINEELDRLFVEYRTGQMESGFARQQAEKVAANIERFRGGDESRMTNMEFREAVGRAMRAGDQSNIPQVQQAAKIVRETVFEPWKNRAVAAGLLPDDIKTETALSYFSRVYNREKINARRPEFQQRITNWLMGDQAAKAAAKERLTDLSQQLKTVGSQVGKLEARLERLAARETELNARMSERGMELERTGKRASRAEDRASSISDELTEIQEFVGAMRAETRNPEMLARLAALEEQATALRRADRPMTEAQMRKVEEEELQSILTGTVRQAAEMMTGRRGRPKSPSFLTWIVTNGGINDVGGDVAAAVGGAKARPGLLSQRGQSVDDLRGKIADEFPGLWGDAGPTTDDVVAWVEDAMRGRQPTWWIESLSEADKGLIEAAKLSDVLEEAFSRAGIDIESPRDVARVFRDESNASMTLEDLDRVVADMEASGADIPAGPAARAVESDIAATRADIAQVRSLIGRAIKARESKAGRLRAAEARGAEAAQAERANIGRYGVLSERLSLADLRRGILEDARNVAREEHAKVREQIEAEIEAWGGRSTADAKSALAAREAQTAARTAGTGERLTMADRAVDRAVRRIIRSDRDMTPDELRSRAGEIIDRIVGGPDGRLPYDAPSGGPRMGAPSDQPPPRGALAARQFMIPDKDIEDFLESDVEHVTNQFLRTFVPDVLLTEKFGDVDMSASFRSLREEHNALANNAKTEKERIKLRKEYETVEQDLAAVRDRIRNVYGFDPKMRNIARVTGAAKTYNGIVDLGGATLNSLNDMSGAIFQHGFTRVLGDAYRPWAKGVLGMSDGYKQAKLQYRAMGIAIETRLNARANDAYDLIDAYRPESRLERGLQQAGQYMQIANLQAPWTDFGKTIAAVVSGNEIFRAAKAVSEGTATKKQIANLAASNIDGNMARRIWDEFQTGGDIVDGVYLPNTGDWRNADVRAAFEGAVGREADIAIITPGQEKPLWLSNPVVNVLGQFKTFTAAASERILIANVQRREAQTLSGLFAGVAAGMLSYRLYTLVTGTEHSDDPRDMLREGISRSGVLGWFEEGNTLMSKATRGQADVYRLTGSDKPLTRYASRNFVGQLLGPTAGKIENLVTATGSAAAGDWTDSDTRRVRRLLPFQNLFYLRRGLDQVEESVNGMIGVE